MRHYHTAASEFNYLQTAEQDLHGSLDGLNACVECCDRQALFFNVLAVARSQSTKKMRHDTYQNSANSHKKRQ